MSNMKYPFRQGYEKPLHYPCTLLMKAKPGCSYDKRLYCDIFSLYYKCEKEWDMGDLKDKIEWWCYATDLERYIKQLQKDLEESQQAALENAQTILEIHKDLDIARQALEEIKMCCADEWIYIAVDKALEQIEHKVYDNEQSV